jgi:hypothetical protein
MGNLLANDLNILALVKKFFLPAFSAGIRVKLPEGPLSTTTFAFLRDLLRASRAFTAACS